MSGMTLWTVDIKKRRGQREWSNVYTVNAPSLAAATAVGQQIVPLEKAVHMNEVAFISMEVRPQILGAGGGTVVALSGNGTIIPGSDLMPMFNTIRVRLQPAAGKPSQKYIRMPLEETRTTGDTIVAGTVGYVQANYADPLIDIPGVVDVDGQPFESATVIPLVQIRQLKRERRSRPGFKRGWVPA